MDIIPKIEDISSFLDDEIIKIAQNEAFDYKYEEGIFCKVFEKLCSALQDEAFRKYDPKK